MISPGCTSTSFHLAPGSAAVISANTLQSNGISPLVITENPTVPQSLRHRRCSRRWPRTVVARHRYVRTRYANRLRPFRLVDFPGQDHFRLDIRGGLATHRKRVSADRSSVRSLRCALCPSRRIRARSTGQDLLNVNSLCGGGSVAFGKHVRLRPKLKGEGDYGNRIRAGGNLDA